MILVAAPLRDGGSSARAKFSLFHVWSRGDRRRSRVVSPPMDGVLFRISVRCHEYWRSLTGTKSSLSSSISEKRCNRIMKFRFCIPARRSDRIPARDDGSGGGKKPHFRRCPVFAPPSLFDSAARTSRRVWRRRRFPRRRPRSPGAHGDRGGIEAEGQAVPARPDLHERPKPDSVVLEPRGEGAELPEDARGDTRARGLLERTVLLQCRLWDLHLEGSHDSDVAVARVAGGVDKVHGPGSRAAVAVEAPQLGCTANMASGIRCAALMVRYSDRIV